MIDLEYTEIDGLLYPNIQFDDAEGYDDLGKYGRQRLNYLHKQKPQQYRAITPIMHRVFTIVLTMDLAFCTSTSFTSSSSDKPK